MNRVKSSMSAFVLGVLLTGFVPAAPALAQSDFYKGKTITVYAGTTPGALYDQWSRLLAQYMGKHIPGNPAMIVQNMPGAGHKSPLTMFMPNLNPMA